MSEIISRATFVNQMVWFALRANMDKVLTTKCKIEDINEVGDMFFKWMFPKLSLYFSLVHLVLFGKETHYLTRIGAKMEVD